jgi:hypothetical protein
MKNFNKYIRNILIEAETPKFDTVDSIKNELDKYEYDADDGVLVLKNDKNETMPDNVKSAIKNSKVWKDYVKEYKDKRPKTIKCIENKSISETVNIPSYSNDKFKLLGKTVTYRSTLFCISYVSGDSFTKTTNDVFENDKDNVIQQLSDLDDYFSFAAACNTVKHKLSKEDKDSTIFNKAKELAKLLSSPETRFEGINKTKESWEDEYTKKRDELTHAFDEGMKEQQNEMSKPDYKWIDPATNTPPKGLSKNAQALLGKGIAKIADLGNKLASKIPPQHTLENDMARATVFGVKLMANGVHAIGELLKLVKKTDLYKKITSKTVDKKIADFKQKYETAKKENYLPTQITKESSEEIKNKCELFKTDFKSLLYDELIPMYYKQVKVFCDSYKDLNGYYILEQTNEGWQTKQTPSGNSTELWNAVVLLKQHIDKIQKLFLEEKLYEEFKDSKMEIYLGGVDKKQPNVPQTELNTWFDKIDSEKTDTEIIDGLKNIINIYKEEILVNPLTITTISFDKYKDVLTKAYQALNVIKQIPVTKEFKIEFKTEDYSTPVKGIKPLKTKDNEKEEVLEVPNEITDKTKTVDNNVIQLGLDTLKNPDEITSYITTLEKQIKITKDDIFKWLEKNAKEDVLKEIETALGNYKDQILPLLYIINHVSFLKNFSESTINAYKLNNLNEYTFDMLNALNEIEVQWLFEENEVSTEVKKETTDFNSKEFLEKLEKLVTEDVRVLLQDAAKKTPNQFKDEYIKWTDLVKKLCKPLNNIDKIKETLEKNQVFEIKDPYKAVCKLYSVIFNMENSEMQE